MLDSLNTHQNLAATTVDGPVIVFAGAGSGKTRALTYRIAYMIEEKHILPFHILAITFTNKATNEMRGRLSALIQERAAQVHISTFHAFCAKLLRREIHHLGFSNRFSIIDEEDQLKVINEVYEDLNIDKKMFVPRKMQKKINYFKCFDSTSEFEMENIIFNEYNKKLKDNNLLDFEDLLIKVRDLFTSFPKILKKYQDIYQYILVDEFQDTNTIQYDIVRMLSEESRNIFVVGDDDQSIYSFRGTNYKNLTRIMEDFKPHTLIKMTENYRSSQVILNGCNHLIANNQYRQEKKLHSSRKGQEQDVSFYQAYNEKDETAYVINQIKELKKDYSLSEIAVLYRSSVLLRNFELSFIEEKIPYKIYGGISYLRRREIKDAIAYLRYIINPEDVFSFKRIVNTPSRGLGLTSIGKVEEYLKKNKTTLEKAIQESVNYLQNTRAATLIQFSEKMRSLRSRLEETNLVDFFDLLMEETEYIKHLQEEEDSEDRVDNLTEFKSILYRLEDDGQIASRVEKLQAAFDDAILSEENQDVDRSEPSVTLTTIHSAKGLEFGVVFLVGMEENIFPNNSRVISQEELEEERRIAYVACTRAKDKLFLSHSSDRLLYGRYNKNPISRFLKEFSEGYATKAKKKVTSVSALESGEKAVYKIGDKVIHKIYGEGIIISKQEDTGQICFTNQGTIRKFDLTHQAISKKE